MKTVIAFGASTSKKSINQQLALWAASQLKDTKVEDVNIIDFEVPIYNIDREETFGIPDKIKEFKELIKKSAGIVISLAEHNGNFTSAFKNLYDWLTRLDRTVWEEKPMLVLATSPGPGGAKTVMELALKSFPYAGGNIKGSFSLPSYYDKFERDDISDENLNKAFKEQLDRFELTLEKI